VKAANFPSSPDAPRTAWGRFWFQPTDPTVLGFMRIVTGLIALYVHLAYCYDLDAFFGPNAYVDQKTANRSRREAPVSTQHWLEWDDKQFPVVVPLMPDRRAAFNTFLRALPEDRLERDAQLAYLYVFLERPVSNETMMAAMSFLKSAGKLNDEERVRMLRVLTAQSAKGVNAGEAPITMTAFLFSSEMNFTPESRSQLWNDALRLSDFLWKIPAWRSGDYQETQQQINLVLEWLIELAPQQRRDFARFLKELPGGAEGRRIIEYLDYWRTDPRETYAQGSTNFSIWFHISHPATMWTVHVCVLIIFLLFSLGVCTRVTSVLAWLAALQYIHRSQQILFGMDTMLNILLFYLMIGPSGAALSVDRLIARYRAARALVRAGGRPVPWAEAVLAGPPPSALANFVMRMLQIHFCIMYASAGLAKLKGSMWWRTTATWYTIGNPEFTPLNYAAYEWVLRKMAAVKPLMLLVFGMFSYFTLFMEICFPFLVWTRIRPFMIGLAIFLHAGIAIIMGLTCFQLLMLALIMCFFPASVVRSRLFWEPGTGPKITLRYNGRNPVHGRLVSFLRAFDLTGQIACRDEPGKVNAVELIGVDGRVHTGYDIVEHAFAHLLFARTIRWLLYVPGVPQLIRSFTGVNGGTEVAKRADAAPSAAKTTTAR
jgi:hypothetical protein